MAAADRTADRRPGTGAEQPAANRPLPGVIGVRAGRQHQYQPRCNPARCKQTRCHVFILSKSFRAETTIAPPSGSQAVGFPPRRKTTLFSIPIHASHERLYTDLPFEGSGGPEEAGYRQRINPRKSISDNVRSIFGIPAAFVCGPVHRIGLASAKAEPGSCE
jgi:hypothetical protein